MLWVKNPGIAKWEPWKLERGPLALPNLQKSYWTKNNKGRVFLKTRPGLLSCLEDEAVVVVQGRHCLITDTD